MKNPSDEEPHSDVELRGRELAGRWTRSEFEAAVPLHAGGDLDPVEAAAVAAWLETHPEDIASVRAAREAREVLVSARSAADVDLWPEIRTALFAEGWIGAAAVEQSAPVRESVRELGAARTLAWTARPRVARTLQLAAAAAAAVVFTGGLGYVLGLGGHPAPTPDDAFAVTTELRASAVADAERRAPRGVGVDASGVFVGSRPAAAQDLALLPAGVQPLAPVAAGSLPLAAEAYELDLRAFAPETLGAPAGGGPTLASDGNGRLIWIPPSTGGQ